MEQGIKADKEIGRNIRKQRQVKGMTQKQLAVLVQLNGCNITRGTLAKIEAGIRHISLLELRSIKLALDIPYDVLLLTADP